MRAPMRARLRGCVHGGGGWPYANGALFSLCENLSPLLRNCIVGNGGVICVPILAKSLYSALDLPLWSNKLEFDSQEQRNTQGCLQCLVHGGTSGGV